MIGSGMKKWAVHLGLKVEHGYAHGSIDGYHITLEEGPGTKLLSIAGPFHGQAVQDAIWDYLSQADEKLRLKKFTIDSSCLVLVFPDLLGVPKGMTVLLPRLLELLKSLECPGDLACALCGNRFLEAEHRTARLLNGVTFVHQECFQQYQESFNRHFSVGNRKLNTGLWGALLGAILAAALWVGLEYVGYYSTWVSVLMVLASWKGYELTGGRPGKSKLRTISTISLPFVALSIILGQYVAAGVFALEHFGTWPGILQVFALIGQNLGTNSSYVAYCIRSVVGGYVFSGIILAYLRQSVVREKTFSGKDVYLL